MNNNNLRSQLHNLIGRAIRQIHNRSRRLYREDREAFNTFIKGMSKRNAGYITYYPPLYFSTDRRFNLNDAKILRKIIDRANGPLVPLYFEGINSLARLMRNSNDTTRNYIVNKVLGIKNEGLARKIKTMIAEGTFRGSIPIDNKNFRNKNGKNFKTFLDSIESVPFSNFMETHHSNSLKRQRVNAAVKGYKVRRPKVVKKKGNALVRMVGNNTPLPRNIVRKIGEKTQLKTISNIESSLRRLP